MDQQSIFVQLSLVIVVGTLVSLLMRLFKQPLIIGYILTGIVVGPSFLHLITDTQTFDTFSQIGITLLLFIIGLELNISVIRKVGRVATLIALTELITIGLLGYLIGIALGYSQMTALIIGIALGFSSTIIVVKVLNDKKEQTRLYGQITIGVLLVEDILAAIALIFLAAGKNGTFSAVQLGVLLLSGVVLAGFLVAMRLYILPKLTKIVASSQEFLFLFAIAWGFGIATLFELVGFSIEVGALFAGVTLASLPYAQEIGSRLKPLRDFFVVVFFIVLGEGLLFGDILSALIPALIFSAVVIFGKPLLVMVCLGLLGYTKRTSFKAALPLSQVSEFSIIFVFLAQSIHLIPAELAATITLIAIITIAGSAYLTHYDEKLYKMLENKLRFFEQKVVVEEKKRADNYPMVLFGYHKGGHEFIRAFQEMHKKFVVIDYDPEVIEHLARQKIHYMYGDATDYELLEEIGIERARLIISTITDFVTNGQLLKHITRVNPGSVFVCHADNYDQAVDLYRHGATYVMLPHYIGSEQLSSFIIRKGISKEAFENYREKHLFSLGRAALR